MSGEGLIQLVEHSDFYVGTNLEGMSDADGAVEAPNGGNSLNWILGHMVYWRNEILALVGGERVWSDGQGVAYRGYPGERRPKDFDLSEALPLERLGSDFRRCGQRLATRLKEASPDPEMAAKLVGLLAHEVYHAGQLGILRRIAGRDGAV